MPFPDYPLTGSPPTHGSNTAWGMVPRVPDPIASANQAITGDLGNLGSLQDLASRVNTFNTGQAIAPYVANLPGYSQMVGQSSANIGSLLRGEISPDTLGLLGRLNAEHAQAGGYGGSPITSAQYLAATGRTSEELQRQGEGELTQAIGRTPVPQLFNVAQFLTTPGEQQAANMAANIYAAAPDPAKQSQALIDLFQRFMGMMQQGQGTGPSLVTPSGTGPSPYTPPVNNFSGGGGPANVTTRGPGRSINTGALFPPSTVGTGTTRPSTGNPFINSIFGPPSFNNSGMLGGLGLDPLLNSLFGDNPQGTGGFGEPITSPGMSYDLGQSSPNYNFPFGMPIQAPSLNLGNQGYEEWWNDPANLFPFEGQNYTPSDLSQFGAPITSPDMFSGNQAPPIDWSQFENQYWNPEGP